VYASWLSVERGIVRQIVDDVKTVNSERALHVDAGLLDILKRGSKRVSFPRREIGSSQAQYNLAGCRFPIPECCTFSKSPRSVGELCYRHSHDAPYIPVMA